MSILMYIGFGFIISSPVWLYLLAKIDPRISRILHKHNCHCNVCYPNAKPFRHGVEQ